MIFDRLNTFGYNKPLADGVFGDVIDLKAMMDAGAGEPVYLFISNTSDAALVGTATFALTASDNADLSNGTTLETLSLPENAERGVSISGGSIPADGKHRYLGVIVSGGATGNVTATLTLEPYTWKPYEAK